MTNSETPVFQDDGWTFTEGHSSMEYCEARKMMGHVDTDFGELIKSVGYALIHSPEKHVEQWQVLAEEVSSRAFYMDLKAISAE